MNRLAKYTWMITVLNLIIMTYLIFRLGIPFVNATESVFSNTDSIGVFLAAQANQFALMQVLLSILGISLAIVALWGFIAIKANAEAAAKMTSEKAVNEMAPKIFSEMVDKFGQKQIQEWMVQTKMEKPQQKNSNEVFSEGVAEMLKDPMEVPNE